MTASEAGQADVLKHADAAYAFALSLTGDAEAAADAVQEAFLRLVEEGGGAEGEAARLRLMRCVFLKSTALRRGQWRRAARERRAAMPAGTQAQRPDEIALARETAEQVRLAVAALAEELRAPVFLHYMEGLTCAEVGQVLDLTEKAVRRRVERGLAELRRTFAGAGLAIAPGLLIESLRGAGAVKAPETLVRALSEMMVRAKAGSAAAASAAAAAKGGIAVKILAGVVLAGALAGGVVWGLPGKKPAPLPAAAPAAPAAQPEAKAPAPEPANVPEVVLDESSPDWVVEPFVGNGAAGQQTFFDGPALQAGGIGRGGAVTVAGDGTAYFLCEAGVVKVTPAGVVRLVLNATGKAEGSVEEVAAGAPLWNPKDNSLYLTGPNCIRRLVVKPDGSRAVEVVAGVPNKPGREDGPAKAATITGFSGFYCTDKGAIYFGDGGIRKLENGTVTTVTKAIQGFGAYDEDGDVFYVSQSRNISAFDVKSGKLTTVEGMPAPKWRKEGYPKGAIENRFNANSDGPALTHASNNSDGMSLVWDRVHKALWLDGPDENRCRWLKDGWVKTVLDSKQTGLGWCHVIGVDSKGRIYIMGGSNPTGLWRAHNKEEVKP